MKKILFPLLALVVPVAVLYGIFHESKARFIRALEEEMAAAQKEGLVVTDAQFEAALPDPAKNAMGELGKAIAKADWKKINKPGLVGAAYLKETDALAPHLAAASALNAIEVDVRDGEKAKLKAEEARMSAAVLANRAAAKSYTGDLAGALVDLEAAGRLRDTMSRSGFSHLSIQSDIVNVTLQDACLEIALKHGKAALPVVRKVFIGDPLTFKIAEACRFDPLFHLATIDSNIDAPKTELVRTKTRTIKKCRDTLRDKTVRNATQVAMTLHDISSEAIVQSRTGIYTFTVPPTTPNHRRMVEPLLQTFFSDLEDPGKSRPSRIYLDPYGNQVRFAPQPKGVMYWSAGKNGVDEKGAGDDHFLVVKPGIVKFR